MAPSTVSRIETALPPEGAVVDVVGLAEGRVCTSFVESVAGEVLSLSIPRDRSGLLVPDPGSSLEVIWKDDPGFLALPVVVGERGRQVLAVSRNGPTAPGQRRAAVRAPLRLPVELTVGGQVLAGLTVDISEGGLRCMLDRIEAGADAEQDAGDVPPPVEIPAQGGRVGVTVVFSSVVVTADAEVVRRPRRQDGRTELSLRFVGIPEVTQDLIRRQVFAGLRDLRLRGVI